MDIFQLLHIVIELIVILFILYMIYQLYQKINKMLNMVNRLCHNDDPRLVQSRRLRKRSPVPFRNRLRQRRTEHTNQDNQRMLKKQEEILKEKLRLEHEHQLQNKSQKDDDIQSVLADELAELDETDSSESSDDSSH